MPWRTTKQEEADRPKHERWADRGQGRIPARRTPAEIASDEAIRLARLPVGLVYFVRAREVERVKIGWTGFDDVKKRLANLQTGSPVELEIARLVPGSRELEKAFHRRFQASRLHGEWFTFRYSMLTFSPEAKESTWQPT